MKAAFKVGFAVVLSVFMLFVINSNCHRKSRLENEQRAAQESNEPKEWTTPFLAISLYRQNALNAEKLGNGRLTIKGTASRIDRDALTTPYLAMESPAGMVQGMFPSSSVDQLRELHVGDTVAMTCTLPKSLILGSLVVDHCKLTPLTELGRQIGTRPEQSKGATKK